MHRPSDFVLPPEQMQLLMRTMLNSANASNYTLLQFLRENFKDMEFTDDLLLTKADGGHAQDRLMTYKRDMRVVKGHDVMPLQFRHRQPPITSTSKFLRCAVPVVPNGAFRKRLTMWRVCKWPS